MRTPIPVETALDRIMRRCQTGEWEAVPLEESDGRVLAEDVIAGEPVPPFDRSMMDGFAVRSADTLPASERQPLVLDVVDHTPAGFVSSRTLGENEAIRIMTGAPIPPGSDAVIQLEKTKALDREGREQIEIEHPVAKGTHVTRRGEYTKQGDTVVSKGEKITPGVLASLASFGYGRVKVYRRPLVGVFAMGTELLPVSSPLEPGKIRNSNSYMLEGQIRRAGALVRSYGVLPDRFDLCSEAVCKALEEVDILVTTGGASVGDYDFIPAILEKLNAEVLFDKVAMRPGSVTTAAVKEEKWIFGLSGNPASCFVGFELFARPVIRTALGANKPQLVRGKAVLQEAVRESNRFTRFMRAVLRINDERVEVRPVKIDKPGMVTALAEANGLLVIPPDSLPRKGDVVDVLWLER